jgi:hypothetical protein
MYGGGKFQAYLGARRFHERSGFPAVEFTDGQGNEERSSDILIEWNVIFTAFG